ncbi:hypothetical protein G6L13_08975 [Agrobacterium tumefaciens]|jgi:TetR/AcrR family transcriptional regulator, transcriptional repressor for nem operon|nr:hypothetical protein [Agrobacterium tumefaciens]|tara:strand:- start:99 stop:278 length:180 start_codon:yes stop_codon:yes gene_type:complete
MPPRDATEKFFGEFLKQSLRDHGHKGSMLVNAATKVAPHDGDFQRIVAEVLKGRQFFTR